MSSEILCPSCQKRLRVNPQAKTKRLRCPVCQTEMAISLSGDNVTAKVLAAGPVPEPPPLPAPIPFPPPPPPVAAVESVAPPPVTMAEPPPAEAAAVSEEELRQPVIAPVASSPRHSLASHRAGSNRAALWIGGGIGLVIVALVAIGGVLLLGLPGNGERSVAAKKPTQAPKNAENAVTSPPEAEKPDERIVERPKLIPQPERKPETKAEQLGTLDSFPPTADFSPPETTPSGNAADALLKSAEAAALPPAAPDKPAENPEPAKSVPDTPSAEKPASEKPAENPSPPTEPAKAPEKEKSKPAKPSKPAPKSGPKRTELKKSDPKKADPKKDEPKGPPPATADCEVCRAQGIVPLKTRQLYVWMEGTPVPKGATAVRDQYCPNCLPDADNAELAAIEDVRLKTAMEGHLEWEKKTGWQLVRAETRRATIHSQLPAAQTQRVGLALEAMTKHIEGLTGSVELTATSPANCNLMILLQKPSYLAFVELLKNDPVYGPGRQEWALVRDVSGAWSKDLIFYKVTPEGPPPEHQAISLLASYQIREATGYRDSPWLNVGYAAFCENVTLKANRVTSLEYALNNLRFDPDWSLAIRRLAAAGGLKTWPDMFPKLLRDYQAEDHLTAYAMVAFLIQYQPRKFLDFIQETKSGMGSAEALEAAYGETIPELQQRWVKALKGR